MTQHFLLPYYLTSCYIHINIKQHNQWCIKQYQNSTHSLFKIVSIIWLLSAKIWNINILGLINDDEVDGIFEFPLKPNFLHRLWVMLVDVFTLNLLQY